MLVIPSIDVRGHSVVRLLRGDFAAETVFSDDPVAVVGSFADAGARRVHIVDLDGARGQQDTGSSEVVRACVGMLASRGVEVQVGGGVRDVSVARRVFDDGATHVVVGSLAVRDPTAAEAMCRAFPGRVLIALDVRDGFAHAQGWTEQAGRVAEHLDRWAAWPAAGVVHTVIDRDGTLGGPELEALRSVCNRFGGPVLASGGVTTLDDVQACADAGASGAIVGRALHAGVFNLRDALRRFSTATRA